MNKKYSKLTTLCYDINGVAMRLQDRLGVNHGEDIYDQMYLADMQQAGFKVINKPKLKIVNADGKVVKVYRPDFQVRRNDICVLVEIKANPDGLRSSYLRQARAYLSVSKKDRAVLLINFAVKPLQREIIHRSKC